MNGCKNRRFYSESNKESKYSFQFLKDTGGFVYSYEKLKLKSSLNITSAKNARQYRYKISRI